MLSMHRFSFNSLFFFGSAIAHVLIYAAVMAWLQNPDFKVDLSVFKNDHAHFSSFEDALKNVLEIKMHMNVLTEDVDLDHFDGSKSKNQGHLAYNQKPSVLSIAPQENADKPTIEHLSSNTTSHHTVRKVDLHLPDANKKAKDKPVQKKSISEPQSFSKLSQTISKGDGKGQKILSKQMNVEKTKQTGQVNPVASQKSLDDSTKDQLIYIDLLNKHIGQHMKIPETYLHKKLSTQLEVKLGFDGKVEKVHVIKSSGLSSFDRYGINALFASSPLPLPKTKTLKENAQTIHFNFSPA